MRTKRVLMLAVAAVLTLALCVTALPQRALAAEIAPGTDGLSTNNDVYIGEIADPNYTDTHYKLVWIVLSDWALSQSDTTGPALPLLSKFCWWIERFNPQGSPSHYPGSDMQQSTLPEYYNGAKAVFSAAEQRAVKDALLRRTSTNWYAGDLPGQKLFPLSVVEVGNLTSVQRIAWDVGETTLTDGNRKPWFTRSSDGNYRYNLVDADGTYTGDQSHQAMYFARYGLRPAMYLDPDAIFLSGASDNTGHFTTFQTPTAATPAAWKLTFRDAGNFAVGASLTGGSTVLPLNGGPETLTIRHRALSTVSAAYTNVTALLADSAGNIQRYGSVNTDTSALSSTVVIPAGLPEGMYTLSLYGEDWNGPQTSDYATGTPYSLLIQIGDPLRFAEQPQPAAALVGATATFSASAVGGTAPYRYVWQRSTDGGASWADVGGDNESYTTSAVTMQNNGYRYRCGVTDGAGNTITSNAAALIVTEQAKTQTDIPQTGDDAPLALLCGLMLLSGAGLLVSGVRRRRKEER